MKEEDPGQETMGVRVVCAGGEGSGQLPGTQGLVLKLSSKSRSGVGKTHADNSPSLQSFMFSSSNLYEVLHLGGTQVATPLRDRCLEKPIRVTAKLGRAWSPELFPWCLGVLALTEIQVREHGCKGKWSPQGGARDQPGSVQDQKGHFCYPQLRTTHLTFALLI